MKTDSKKLRIDKDRFWEAHLCFLFVGFMMGLKGKKKVDLIIKRFITVMVCERI